MGILLCVVTSQNVRQAGVDRTNREVVIVAMDPFKAGSEKFSLGAIQDDQRKFDRLWEAWYVERGVSSSLSELTSYPSYLRIIGMGATDSCSNQA